MKLVFFGIFTFLNLSSFIPENFWKQLTKNDGKFFSFKSKKAEEKNLKKHKNNSILFLIKKNDGRLKIEEAFEIENLENFFYSCFDKKNNFIFLKNEKELKQNDFFLRKYFFLKILSSFLLKEDNENIKKFYEIGYLNNIFSSKSINKAFKEENFKKIEISVNYRLINLEFKLINIIKCGNLYCNEKLENEKKKKFEEKNTEFKSKNFLNDLWKIILDNYLIDNLNLKDFSIDQKAEIYFETISNKSFFKENETIDKDFKISNIKNSFFYIKILVYLKLFEFLSNEKESNNYSEAFFKKFYMEGINAKLFKKVFLKEYSDKYYQKNDFLINFSSQLKNYKKEFRVDENNQISELIERLYKVKINNYEIGMIFNSEYVEFLKNSIKIDDYKNFIFLKNEKLFSTYKIAYSDYDNFFLMKSYFSLKLLFYLINNNFYFKEIKEFFEICKESGAFYNQRDFISEYKDKSEDLFYNKKFYLLLNKKIINLEREINSRLEKKLKECLNSQTLLEIYKYSSELSSLDVNKRIDDYLNFSLVFDTAF